MRPPTSRHARRVRRGALLAALLLPTAASCGIGPTGVITLGPAPAALQASPARSFDASPGTTQYLVYFYQNDRLTPAYRFAKGGVTERLVLEALLSGPTPTERSAGYYSAVPSGLVAKARADGKAGEYNLSAPLGQRAKAQFVCTMQYYDEIDSIGIQVNDSNVIWNACSDTTNQYIPMHGDQSVAPIPGASG